MTSTCGLGQGADRAVRHQLRPFPDGGQRRLQLMGDLVQEAGLLVLELDQPQPHPVDLPPQILQVLRAGHAHRIVEVAFTEPFQRCLHLADRFEDQDRRARDEEQRDRDQGHQLPVDEGVDLSGQRLHRGRFPSHGFPARGVERPAQAPELAVVVREIDHQAGLLAKRRHPRVQPVLRFHHLFEDAQLAGQQVQGLHAPGRFGEIPVGGLEQRVQLRVGQDRKLARAPLHAGDLLDQQPGALGDLDGVDHRPLALAGQLVDRDRVVDQGEDERQHRERKAGQDQHRERLRVEPPTGSQRLLSPGDGAGLGSRRHAQVSPRSAPRPCPTCRSRLGPSRLIAAPRGSCRFQS